MGVLADSRKEMSARDSTRSQIAELEKGLSTTKYNKSSQGYFAQVKAKIAILKQKLEKQNSAASKPGDGFAVRKTGDGTVVLLGFPSVGKSTLLSAITNKMSKAASYAFTTLTCIPGLLEYKHAKIQILDVPGIIEGAAAGTGRGKEVLQVLRNAEFVLIVLDVFHPEHFEILKKEVAEFNIRINKPRPDVRVTRTMKNGIRVGNTVPLTRITHEQIKTICNAFRIMNAEVLIRSDIDEDDFIDVIENNKTYLNAIAIFNKIDLADPATIEKSRAVIEPDLMISAYNKDDVAKLKDLLYDRMLFVRIFLKEVGKQPDMEVPLIMRRGQTLGDVCEKLHKDFMKNFTFARIWGKSVKFSGQKILKTSHVVMDQDVVELHIR